MTRGGCRDTKSCVSTCNDILAGGSILRYSHRYMYIFFLAVPLLLALVLLSSTAAPVFAQSRLDTEEQRRRAQEEEEQMKRRQAAPDVRLFTEVQDSQAIDLPEEKPCFVLNSLILEGDVENDFPWAQEYLNKF